MFHQLGKQKQEEILSLRSEKKQQQKKYFEKSLIPSCTVTY